MSKYKSCTKKELIEVVEELETEAKDIEATCEHVARRIKECLEAIGHSHDYYGKLGLYDLADQLEDVTEALGDIERGERHPLAHMLPECSSLGELEELKDDLKLFILKD